MGTEPHHSYLFPTRWLDEQRHKLRDRWNFRSVWKAIANRDNWVPVDTYLESSDKGWQLGAHRPFPRKWCSKLHDPPWVDGDDVKLRSRQIIWDKTQRLLDLWDRLYKIDCGVNDCPFVRPFDQTTVKLRRQEAKKEEPNIIVAAVWHAGCLPTSDKRHYDGILYSNYKKTERLVNGHRNLEVRRLPTKVFDEIAHHKDLPIERTPAQHIALQKDQERFNAQTESLWNVHKARSLNLPKFATVETEVKSVATYAEYVTQLPAGKKEEEAS